MAIRILHVLNGLGNGGTESFLMNLYRSIDREKVQFDFLVRSNDNLRYEQEVKELGGNIYTTPPYPQKLIKNFKAVNNFFREHPEYEIIHVHSNSLMYIYPLIVAKKQGIKCRIVHSHSTKTQNDRLYKYIHLFNRLFVGRFSTHRFACSTEAGNWMFKDLTFEIINNGIDINKFSYKEDVRNEVRHEFGISNEYVIGHVGRFVNAKNHQFLLNLFKIILEKDVNVKLLLVGNGELKSKIQRMVAENGMGNAVVFTDARNDVERLMQAMDVFVFPSVFEGLGIVAIEAQSSGLHTIVSEHIPQEAFVSGYIESISLNEGANRWASRILELKELNVRINTVDRNRINTYDIKTIANKLEKFYLDEI